MVDSAAACARGRARSSRSRTQGEAFGGAKGEPEDADPAQISSVIRACGVAESTISDYFALDLAPAYRSRKMATARASGPTTMFAGMIAPEKPPLRIA